MSGSTVTAGPPTFTEIPVNWRVPGAYMEIKPAVNPNALLEFPAKGLAIGQMYATGTAIAGQAYVIYSAQQAAGLFGAGSHLALMCAAWIKVNPYTTFVAIAVADAAGAVKAAGSVTIAGAASAPGTLAIGIGGVRVQVPVNIGDTAAEVAANLYAQIGLQGQSGYPYLPWTKATYVAAASVVTLTSTHGGTIGNTVSIVSNPTVSDATPPGLTVTIVALTGGATDPDPAISAVIAGLNDWYTDIAWPWTDATNIGVISAYLTEVYGAMEAKDGQAYVLYSGTYGTILTFAPNSQYICDLPMQNPVAPPSIVAAACAAACCFQTAQQPSLQLRTVPLPGIAAPAPGDLFSADERQALLEAGHSTFNVDANGVVYLERMVTTRRIDPDGVLNNAFFDLSSTKVPTRVRFDWDTYVGQVWPRAQLCQDGSLAADYNPNAVTPKRMKASWTARSAVYEKAGWIQNSAQTAAASTFVIDPADGNRLDGNQQIDIMGNLIVLAGSLQFVSNN